MEVFSHAGFHQVRDIAIGDNKALLPIPSP